MGTNSREYMRAWRSANPESQKSHSKKDRETHPDRVEKHRRQGRDSGASLIAQRKSRYGITEQQYQEMLIAQSDTCAVCEKSFDGKTPYIDHCHETGKVRGLVHMMCNTMMGHAKDDPIILEKAAAYLRKFRNLQQ